MVSWFVVYLIKPNLLPLLQLMVLWFVTSLAAHGAMVCCLSYKAWFVAAHGAVVLCLSYNAWFVASLAAHGAVVCCLSYKA